MYKYYNELGEHQHTYNDKPLLGTSTVVGVISKGQALSWWASGICASEFGWTQSKLKDGQGKVIGSVHLEDRLKVSNEALERVKSLTDREYLDLLDNAYKAHSATLKSKAVDGVDLHSELEDFVRFKMGKSPERVWSDKIKPFIDWCNDNVKRFIWSEVNCYSLVLHIGGISDCGVELNNGEYAIVDFKSSKTAYISQFIQCALYAIQIEENGMWTADGLHSKKLDKPISQVIIFPFGALEPKAEARNDIEKLKIAGINCVSLYRFTELGF